MYAEDVEVGRCPRDAFEADCRLRVSDVFVIGGGANLLCNVRRITRRLPGASPVSSRRLRRFMPGWRWPVARRDGVMVALIESRQTGEGGLPTLEAQTARGGVEEKRWARQTGGEACSAVPQRLLNERMSWRFGGPRPDLIRQAIERLQAERPLPLLHPTGRRS